MKKSSNISLRRKAALSDGGADYTAKREELVNIAAKLFKEKGYKTTTLADIGKEAGLDRATVYYYVGSKEELFREAVEGILDGNILEAERLLAANDMGPREKLQHFVEKLMKSYEDNYPHMYVYIQEQMHQVAKESSKWAKEIQKKTRRVETAVMDMIQDGIAQGVLRNDVSVRLAANALFGMFNWTHRWHKPNSGDSAEAIAAAFCKIFFDGMENKVNQPKAMTAAKRARSRGVD